MLALSVLQPWAWAIMAGIKPVENRSWRTNYRGPLVIQAGQGKRCDVAGREHIAAIGHAIPDELPRGVILGTVELVDVLTQAQAMAQFGPAWVDHDPNGFCWVLEKPRLLATPRPCRGKLSLFQVEDIAEELFL